MICRRLIPVFLLLVRMPVFLFSQPADNNALEITIHPRDIYMIPQTVYVGDRGRLVITPGSAFDDVPAFILQSPVEMPGVSDLVIDRIELEKRSSIRLLVDFVSYAPGLFVLPPVKIPSVNSQPILLTGLEVRVASILVPGQMELSGPALPLAVPGTGILIYSGIGILMLLLTAAAGGFFWFRRYFGPFKKRRRQQKLLLSLEQKIRILRTEGNDPEQQNELFSLLAGEFREYLGFVTGVDCRVLTPVEFSELGIEIPGNVEPDFLGKLFRHWDYLRFSGQPLLYVDVLGILDELGIFFSRAGSGERAL